jgi:hypothetical protein
VQILGFFERGVNDEASGVAPGNRVWINYAGEQVTKNRPQPMKCYQFVDYGPAEEGRSGRGAQLADGNRDPDDPGPQEPDEDDVEGMEEDED